MADQQVLREFLVKLGYVEDELGRRRMVDSINGTTASVLKMMTAIQGAATVLVLGVAKVADQMEALYYASQRTRSSVGDIRALQYAFSQLGGTAEQASGLIEKIAENVRRNPAFASLIESYTGTKFRDAVTSVNELSVAFQNLLKTYDYSTVVKMAEKLGITEADLQVMLRNVNGAMTKLEDESKRIADRVIGDQQRAAEAAVQFNRSYRRLLTTFEAFSIRLQTDLGRSLSEQLDRLQQAIEQNSDAITATINDIVHTITWMSEQVTRAFVGIIQLYKDLRDAYDRLSPSQREFVKTFGEGILLWQAFSMVMNASPIGRLIYLAGAIGWLYNSYKRWKDTGQNDDFIDWSKWGPRIEAAITAIERFSVTVDDLVKKYLGEDGWTKVMEIFLAFMAGKFVIGIVSGFASASAAAIGFGATLVSTFAAGAPAIIALLGLLDILDRIINKKGLLATAAATDAQEKAQNPGYTPARERNDLTGDVAGATGPIGVLRQDALPMSFGMQMQRGFDNMVGKFKPPQTSGSWGNSSWMRTMSTLSQGSGMIAQGLYGSGGLDINNPRVKEAYDFFISQGYSAGAAAGITANLWHESKLDPGAVGDGGLALGIAQWHPDRQLQFQRVMGRSMQGSSLRDQLAFLVWELRHGNEGAAGQMLDQAKTPEEGALGGLAAERPAGWHGAFAPGPQYNPRAASARSLYDQANASSNAAPVGGPNTKSVVVTQNNNVNVNGVNDPDKAANLVKQELDRNRADMVRNGLGAMR